ncbi:MAG TPA: PASTA domain-containing protein [Gemmatimonadales bacterium]|nr:PASTA domain-containing protein [Gemmatimonadales bacterium]
MRIRRHTGSGLGTAAGADPSAETEHPEAEPGAPQGDPWRRFGRDIGIVAAVALVGYAISAYWVSPGAVFASEHAVPRVLEMRAEDARDRLTGLGFRVRVDGERASTVVPRGAVVWQDPPPETVIPPNSTVQLVLSGGPAPAAVPDVVGLSLQFAEGILEAAGMKVGRVDRVTSGQEADVVLSVRPPPGNGRPRGSSVELLVSAGRGGGQ